MSQPPLRWSETTNGPPACALRRLSMKRRWCEVRRPAHNRACSSPIRRDATAVRGPETCVQHSTSSVAEWRRKPRRDELSGKNSMTTSEKKSFRSGLALGLAGLVLAAAAFAWWAWPSHAALPPLNYQPRQNLDSSGFTQVAASTKWDPAGSLQEIANAWRIRGIASCNPLTRTCRPLPGQEDQSSSRSGLAGQL